MFLLLWQWQLLATRKATDTGMGSNWKRYNHNRVIHETKTKTCYNIPIHTKHPSKVARHCCFHSNRWWVYKEYRKFDFSDNSQSPMVRTGIASINQFCSLFTDVHTVRRVTEGHVHVLHILGLYRAKIVTYCSVFKLWFTLRASASSAAPESPTVLDSRLWKRVLQN